MTMAHDPTRSWPTGKGPDDTSIPGAAWLELLDGQAFPVVGAGAMVWNGTMWVPVSTQNRLPVDAAVSGTVDVSDRADRQLGKVALSGQLPQPEDNLPVELKGMVLGSNQRYQIERFGQIAANTQETVFETTSPTVIDRMEWSGNDPSRLRLRIEARNVHGEYAARTFQIARRDGSGREAALSFSLINMHITNLCDILIYDTENNYYKVGFKDLRAALGLRVTIENTSDEPLSTAIVADVREYA